MFKVATALLLAAASIAPAQAATSITFSPGSNVIPSFTTATVFQDFTNATVGNNIANGNGQNYTVNALLDEIISGSVRTFQSNVGGQAIGPAVTPAAGPFLAVGRSTPGPATPGSYSVALTGAQVFSFVFGGLGATDSLTLAFTSGAPLVLTGTQICGGAANVGCALLATGRVTYDLGGTAEFTRATFASPVAAFEFTDLASAAPEPATWALMILGFGIVGSALRRRKGKATLAAA